MSYIIMCSPKGHYQDGTEYPIEYWGGGKQKARYVNGEPILYWIADKNKAWRYSTAEEAKAVKKDKWPNYDYIHIVPFQETTPKKEYVIKAVYKDDPNGTPIYFIEENKTWIIYKDNAAKFKCRKIAEGMIEKHPSWKDYHNITAEEA